MIFFRVLNSQTDERICREGHAWCGRGNQLSDSPLAPVSKDAPKSLVRLLALPFDGFTWLCSRITVHVELDEVVMRQQYGYADN